jgi:hypothetical protein
MNVPREVRRDNAPPLQGTRPCVAKGIAGNHRRCCPGPHPWHSGRNLLHAGEAGAACARGVGQGPWRLLLRGWRGYSEWKRPRSPLRFGAEQEVPVPEEGVMLYAPGVLLYAPLLPPLFSWLELLWRTTLCLRARVCLLRGSCVALCLLSRCRLCLVLLGVAPFRFAPLGVLRPKPRWGRACSSI